MGLTVVVIVVVVVVVLPNPLLLPKLEAPKLFDMLFPKLLLEVLPKLLFPKSKLPNTSLSEKEFVIATHYPS